MVFFVKKEEVLRDLGVLIICGIRDVIPGNDAKVYREERVSVIHLIDIPNWDLKSGRLVHPHLLVGIFRLLLMLPSERVRLG